MLIASDAIARGHFDAGRYGDCALRLGEIAPPLPKRLQLSQMGVLALCSDNPMLGNCVLDAIEDVALVNPLVRRMVAFMGPATSPESLPDFSMPAIRQALTAPREAGGLGLTPIQAAPILRAGEQPDSFTGIEIESIAMHEATI